MIDVLLINPTTIRTYKRLTADLLSMPPLGLLYIGTHLNHYGFKTELCDFGVKYMTSVDFVEMLSDRQPKIVGISTTTECYSPTRILIALIKRVLPSATIVLGGPSATFSYNKFFDETEVDYVIRGEGEHTFLQLTDAIINRHEQDIPQIQGLVYRGEDGGIVRTAPHERIKNLDDLLWPDRDMLDRTKYLYPFTISTSRGCPGDCIFCSSRQYWGKKIFFRSVESIYAEIRFLIDKYGMSRFFIIDDTFTMVPRRAKQLSELIIRDHLNVTWGCESRADVVDEDLLNLMYQAGCRKIQFGLESANNEILHLIGKKVTREQVHNAVILANKVGFDINVSFIIGHPFDTHETIRQTLDFALFLFRNYSVNPYCAIIIPYPGTSIYESPEMYNIQILSQNFDNFTMDNAIVSSENFTPHDLRMYFQSFQDVLLGKIDKLFYH